MLQSARRNRPDHGNRLERQKPENAFRSSRGQVFYYLNSMRMNKPRQVSSCHMPFGNSELALLGLCPCHAGTFAATDGDVPPPPPMLHRGRGHVVETPSPPAHNASWYGRCETKWYCLSSIFLLRSPPRIRSLLAYNRRDRICGAQPISTAAISEKLVFFTSATIRTRRGVRVALRSRTYRPSIR